MPVRFKGPILAAPNAGVFAGYPVALTALSSAHTWVNDFDTATDYVTIDIDGSGTTTNGWATTDIGTTPTVAAVTMASSLLTTYAGTDDAKGISVRPSLGPSITATAVSFSYETRASLYSLNGNGFLFAGLASAAPLTTAGALTGTDSVGFLINLSTGVISAVARVNSTTLVNTSVATFTLAGGATSSYYRLGITSTYRSATSSTLSAYINGSRKLNVSYATTSAAGMAPFFAAVNASALGAAKLNTDYAALAWNRV